MSFYDAKYIKDKAKKKMKVIVDFRLSLHADNNTVDTFVAQYESTIYRGYNRYNYIFKLLKDGTRYVMSSTIKLDIKEGDIVKIVKTSHN